MPKINRHTAGILISTSVLFGLAGFSMSLFGNDLGFYDELRVSAHVNNPHQISDRLNPRLISVNERSDHLYQVDESSIGSVQALHSATVDKLVAFTNPTLDYTTGTSN